MYVQQAINLFAGSIIRDFGRKCLAKAGGGKKARKIYVNKFEIFLWMGKLREEKIQ